MMFHTNGNAFFAHYSTSLKRLCVPVSLCPCVSVSLRLCNYYKKITTFRLKNEIILLSLQPVLGAFYEVRERLYITNSWIINRLS